MRFAMPDGETIATKCVHDRFAQRASANEQTLGAPTAIARAHSLLLIAIRIPILTIVQGPARMVMAEGTG